MIKEAYCSYEVAKLLKEKGFDEPTWTCYIGNEISHYDYTSSNSELIDGVISAPTHQMVMAWLREEHNIFIEISVDEMLKGVGYQWVLYKEIRPYSGWGDSYEEAVEAGIKYVLENLI